MWLTLDGVTYRHGHRDAIQTRIETDVSSSEDTARELAEAVLQSLDGDDLQLKAGWLGLRWLAPDEASWASPAYLFAFDSSAPGAFTIAPTGVDDEPWPLPPREG